MTTPFDEFVSQFIPAQFPITYRERGESFVAFVQAYYQWLEGQSQAVGLSRQLLSYADVDTAPNVSPFRQKYLQGLPAVTAADQRLCVKHALDLYRSKGTSRAYELLLMMLYGVSSQVFVPNRFLFSSSGNQWLVSEYLEVSGSPFLDSMPGNMVVAASNTGSALVVSVVRRPVSGKVVNIITVSDIDGYFSYGDRLLCPAVPDLTVADAPVVVGSLSGIAITDGGRNFAVGDMPLIVGGGTDGIALVTSTANTTGHVSFNIVSGGWGFTLTSNVVISGGSGTGAGFSIGGLANEAIIDVNTDIIGDYADTELENPASGFLLSTSGVYGTFHVGDSVSTSTNVNILGVSYVQGSVQQGEALSNSVLGISELKVTRPDGNLITVTGTNAALTNANIAGATLASNVTASVVKVVAVLGLETITGTANVTAANSTTLTVANSVGYFVPTGSLLDANGGATATISNTTRLTNWGFPGATVSNLDTPLSSLLSYEQEVVGSIAFLTGIAGGDDYVDAPQVSVLNDSVYAMALSDGSGGFYGADAVIQASVTVANGVIMTAVPLQSGYGWQQGEDVTLLAADGSHSANARLVLDRSGKTLGRWADTTSFLSSDQLLQDSYYWQLFSVETRAQAPVDTFNSIASRLVHPCGVLLFGRWAAFDAQTATQDVAYSSFVAA